MNSQGTTTYHYCMAGVPMVCEIYWEAVERQTWDNPGYPAQAVLESCDVGGVNIINIMSNEQIEEIEVAFLEQQT